MSNGYAADEPRHVEMAAIDEDVRAMAIYGSRDLLTQASMKVLEIPNSRALWLVLSTGILPFTVQRAIRVLRHFGLLVEHGDGVVSIKESA